MRHLILLIAALALACSGPQPTSILNSGGVFVDGGGDLVNCRPEAGALLVGALSLDYVLTYNALNGTDDDPTGTAAELLGRMTAVIADKVPELSDSWRDYLRLVGSQDNNEPRIWRASSAPLTDVVNTDPVRDFPSNCIKVGPSGESQPDLQQLVRRRYHVVADAPKIFYEYDAALLSVMKSQEPLQYAYLIAHEWLWDYVDSGYGNRWINRLLNSKSIETMTPAAVRDYLRSHGFSSEADGIVGQPSQLAAELAERAANTPRCDVSRRASVTFAAGAGRLVVEPGAELTMTLETQRLDELVGSAACGVGFFYAHRAAGAGAAAGTIELRRGRMVESANFASGISRRQDMWYGMCGEQDCWQRSGRLGHFFWPEETGVTEWQLRVKNTGGDRLELTVPHLTFYGLR